jgi:hypothetical protein
VCTEPNIKLIKQTNGTYTQKTTTKEITFKPDEYITIQSLDNTVSTKAIKVADDIIIKNVLYFNEESDYGPMVRIDQSIKTIYGETLTTLNDIRIPATFSYGNISYTSPVINFAQPTEALLLTQAAKPSNALLESFIAEFGLKYLPPQLLVEVSQ